MTSKTNEHYALRERIRDMSPVQLEAELSRLHDKLFSSKGDPDASHYIEDLFMETVLFAISASLLTGLSATFWADRALAGRRMDLERWYA